MDRELWGCQICGNDSFGMSREEHEKLGCDEKWLERNRRQFASLDPRLTEGWQPLGG